MEFGNKEIVLAEYKKKDSGSDDADKREFFYGSPAIWLKNKNRKRHSDGKKSNSIFSNRSFSRVGVGTVGIKSFNQKKSEFPNSNQTMNDIESLSPLKILHKNLESPVMLKVSSDDKEKNIPMYSRHQSFIEALRNNNTNRTRKCFG